MIPSMGGPRIRATIKFGGLATAVCLFLLWIWGLPHRTQRVNRNIPLRILPLGDSITYGWQPANAQNGTNGYRAQILHDLVWAFYKSVEFVGTQHSGLMYNNENEGYPGFTISQIQGAMKAGLEMRPNIVLLHAGTEDLNQPETSAERWRDAPQRLGRLIDGVLKICPDAVILVAMIIQAEQKQTRANIQAFNDAIPELVEKRAKKGFKVAIVDHSVIGTNELVDGLHPSYAGYEHMGRIWCGAVRAVSGKGLVSPPVVIKP